MRLVALLFLLMMTCFCSDIKQSNAISAGELEKAQPDIITYHSYTPTNIPGFFTALFQNHAESIYQISKNQYHDFCQTHSLDTASTENKEKYLTILFLHELFTSESVYNCSKGKILNIPYFWHWVNPNPRHQIRLVETGNLLSETRPPTGYERYNSYADADRKPFLYLSELLSETPKYFTESCDTFSTFGWCSEREMAFVALTSLMGYDGKVVSQGNHSYSELKIPMKKTNGQQQYFTVKVDNTFDHVDWEVLTSAQQSGWSSRLGDIPLAQWYNDQAHATAELNALRNLQLSSKAMEQIETKVARYFYYRLKD